MEKCMGLKHTFGLKSLYSVVKMSLGIKIFDLKLMFAIKFIE